MVAVKANRLDISPETVRPYPQCNMKNTEVSVAVLAVVLLSLTGVKCQGLAGGSTYVEKQLLCALDRAPCDVLGGQIKSKANHINIC